ncbi:MAG TPA: hypothetical protein VNI77_05495 [Nitrososphaera sp.]|nr:hypothetical protein [Nitrososphaera sp.]
MSREDWGYQAYVTLKRDGSVTVGAAVYESCEKDQLVEWTLYWRVPAGSFQTKYTTSTTISATKESNVTVFMEWNSAGTVVTWYYQVNSGTKTSFGSFTKESQVNPYFNTGYYNLGLATAKYFQGGVGSAYNIGQSGWYAWVKNPAYATTVGGSYNSYFSPARTVEGDQAWMDASFKWGGAAYTGVWADNSTVRAHQIRKDKSSSSTMEQQ